MTIRHLEIFIAVAECKKMSAAAEKLYITQPTVSQAIRELEAYYNVKLFERLSQKIYITKSGEKLLAYARHITSLLALAKEELGKDLCKPILQIGCSVSVGTVLLENYLEDYEKINPKADVYVTINNTSEIENLLCTSKLDFAIVEGNIHNKDLICHNVCQDELFLAVGKKHPFYSRQNISLDELNDQDFISREEGSVDRNQFEVFLNEHNIRINKKWISTNIISIRNAVRSGRGIGIFSSLLINDDIKTGSLHVLNVDQIHIKRQIQLVYHKNKYLSDAMKDFIKMF